MQALAIASNQNFADAKCGRKQKPIIFILGIAIGVLRGWRLEEDYHSHKPIV
jgi:hypothetical protein